MEITAKTLEGLHAAAKETCTRISSSQTLGYLSGLYRSPLPQLVRPTPDALRGQRGAGGAPRARRGGPTGGQAGPHGGAPAGGG